MTENPTEASRQLDLARNLLEAGKPGEALFHLRIAEDSATSRGELRYLMGLAHLRMGDVDAGITELLAASKALPPGDPRVSAALAEAVRSRESSSDAAPGAARAGLEAESAGEPASAGAVQPRSRASRRGVEPPGLARHPAGRHDSRFPKVVGLAAAISCLVVLGLAAGGVLPFGEKLATSLGTGRDQVESDRSAPAPSLARGSQRVESRSATGAPAWAQPLSIANQRLTAEEPAGPEAVPLPAVVSVESAPVTDAPRPTPPESRTKERPSTARERNRPPTSETLAAVEGVENDREVTSSRSGAIGREPVEARRGRAPGVPEQPGGETGTALDERLPSAPRRADRARLQPEELERESAMRGELEPEATEIESRPVSVPAEERRTVSTVEKTRSRPKLSRVDSPPVLATPLRIRYPRELASQKMGGAVMLWVLIDESGQVDDVEVLDSSGLPALDEAAVDGIRQASYTPARRDGAPVATWIQQRVIGLCCRASGSSP